LLIDAVRTPIGRYGGALASVRPDDLLASTYKALIERNGIDAAVIGDVYAGCANQAGEDNRDVARMAALLAGFPVEVPGVTVNRNCASGLEAVNQAAKALLAGEGDVMIGSGVESMSRAPWSLPKPERVPTTGAPPLYDTTLGWRYVNPRMEALYPVVSLGETAEAIAADMAIDRQAQDRFALESQRRAVAAIGAGRFASEIVSVEVAAPAGAGAHIVDTDEHPRSRRAEGGRLELATSLAELAKLRPAFRHGGTVTAGNSSGINDGAAAVLLARREAAQALGLKPLARWVGSAVAGVEPSLMGYGPVPATQKLLGRLGLDIANIGLVEINEAFAAQVIGCARKLGLREEITNVNGGAIALGHPLGCSGARILTTLIHEMRRRAPSADRPYYGLATLCVGVGMGVSTLVEWIGD
jgi:acetyl-CoA acetyltransferase family protein